ncbi:MAG TPA: beta-ketoacyl synthase N-terminal-like domain-containing protein, partial [Acidobacteriota bacterium]|nr:beta-ketoacyl synthase N-terminal-like domain-containing protein [Acidobacteriota bacterium]
MERRVVVTGVGLITPVGLTTDVTWSSLLEGRSGVGPITKFDASDYAVAIAGEVSDLNATDFVSKKDLKKMDLHIVYALAATADAWAMASVAGAYEADRIGTIIGSGI